MFPRLARFGDQMLANRLRLIRIVPEFLMQTLKLLVQLPLKRLDALAIHATGSPIRFDPLPSHHQVLRLVDLVT